MMYLQMTLFNAHAALSPLNFLFKFGSSGSLDGKFNSPFGVTFDPNTGNIVVTDTNNHRIQVFGSLLQPDFTIPNPAPNIDDAFGFIMEIDGNNILVAAPFDDGSGADGGSSYLIDATTGSIIHTIPNPGPELLDQFGWDLDLEGNHMVVCSCLYLDGLFLLA